MLLAVGAAGCSNDLEPTDYAVENRTGFLTACARPLDDPRLLNDVCACAYDRIEAELRFEEFVDLDTELLTASQATTSDTATSDARAQPGTETDGLPEEIVQLIADCFVEEAGL